MKKNILNPEYLIVFLVSFITITLELFLTRILYLKAWNHVVYVVIPFAILGYGIGANLYMIFKTSIDGLRKNYVYSLLLFTISLAIIFTTYWMINLPIRVSDLLGIFTSITSIGMLLSAYVIYMLPFVFIGFLIVYIFSRNPAEVHRLYFTDLVGAGIAAVMFFPLINGFAVVRSLMMMALLSLLLALCISMNRKRAYLYSMAVFILFLVWPFFPEPRNYTIDEKKGWEWIPGYFPRNTYQPLSFRWHPLGRTDIYRIIDESTRKHIYATTPGTFEIDVKPRPEFAYFSTNFLAGTPVYNLSPGGMERTYSRLALFSESMEAPYILLDKPRVLVIGVGGGRDIFMAKTHGATEVLGAEINPAIVKAMRPGGVMYDYSGRVYTSPQTKVSLIDGRHLVKTVKERSVDLIILNGVDTFSGLSSGAYAYAESYLYTKNAIKDYLRVLKDNGMINFNRWLFRVPRETLRLHAIALQALKEMGARNPSEHIIIGGSNGWSLVMIKKTPFTPAEIDKVYGYFRSHGVLPIYPPSDELKKNLNDPYWNFAVYTEYFKKGKEHVFGYFYPFDISVISDDNPFFYKYYKLSSFNPFDTYAVHHTGPVIFLTQTLVFAQALVMILLFILLPLYVYKKNDIARLPQPSWGPFIIYFACLGSGFMFIEIPLMQRFVFLLGSPIYSITVILSTLLISTGLGSFALDRLLKIFSSSEKLLTAAVFTILVYLLGLIAFGAFIYEPFMGSSFSLRIAVVACLIFPLGFVLGLFFPMGMRLISRNFEDTIAWAWAINGGFSVLGSILAIIFAQFLGFNAILLMAATIYLGSILAYTRLEKYL